MCSIKKLTCRALLFPINAVLVCQERKQITMEAILSNAQHPEYGVVTIPFPIQNEEYNHALELLEALEIGDTIKRDCKVEEIQGGLPILKRLEKVAVNIDELDYWTVKRITSYLAFTFALVKAHTPVLCRCFWWITKKLVRELSVMFWPQTPIIIQAASLIPRPPAAATCRPRSSAPVMHSTLLKPWIAFMGGPMEIPATP